MKVFPSLIAALALVPSALAVDQTKSAIVWFEDSNTPDSVVNQVKDSIVQAGGKITHVYTIIKGFSVVAPEKALEFIQTMGVGHDMRVEEDQTVTAS